MVSDRKDFLSMPTVNWREFACGWSAGFVNIIILHPINKLLFRQMLHGVSARNAYSDMKTEGLFILYRGILPPLCQKTLTISLMFGVYEEVQSRLMEQDLNRYTAKFIGGMVSGLSELLLMPFERIQALLCDKNYNTKLKNMKHAFFIIRREYGYSEYFRGTTPFILRIAPTNAIFFLGKEELHKQMPRMDSHVGKLIYEFISGAVLGSFLSCVFYPLTVGKITMQTKLGGDFEKLTDVMHRIYVERGRKVRYIFYGVPTNVTRAFLSWGIMNAAYEIIKSILIH